MAARTLWPESSVADHPARALEGVVRGAVHVNAHMAKRVSWRAGGAAAVLFVPADLEDLATALARLPAECPVQFIGLGSNLLVREGGFEGVLVLTHRVLSTAEAQGEGRFCVGAGVPCAKLARMACRLGHVDAAFFAGIPGTVGGALHQNAGAFGSETWRWVHQATLIDRSGALWTTAPSEVEVGYRQINLPRVGFFVAAEFDFGPQQTSEAGGRIRELLVQRAGTQPTGRPSCGSVFRNPDGDYAGRLIEAAGLKGLRRGDACISDKHANFILNLGRASATDIEWLMRRAQEVVAARFGIVLHPEVCIIGELGPAQAQGSEQ